MEVNDRPGLLYERVSGPSMVEAFRARPWTLLSSARLLAELHTAMHASDVTAALPSQRERLARKIRQGEGLRPALREAAVRVLEGMPGGERLCHGDFHPGNVILSHRGPVIIDWLDATLGNPLADVARTSVILLGVRGSANVSWLERLLVGWYHQVYMRRTFELRAGGEREYRAWHPIVAAARMSEGIKEMGDWLREQVEAGLG